MIGQTISHYRILEKIGEGGMGEVYLAEDTSLDRRVALKFLPQYLQQDVVAQRRFIREAKSAAALDHPYICHIHEIGEVDGKNFIAMEYVEGNTLQQRLAQGRIPLRETLRIGTEIAEALEEAHQKGIIHRDLKPSNIMLTPKGHAKVMDFGLAKRLPEAGGVKDDITAALTREGTTLGTLAYMSPEQTRGKEVDNRGDIFSFGILLYEMLTGVHPFRRDTQVETSNAILNESFPPLDRYTEDTSDLLQHTLEKMLAKDPSQRYQSVHEIWTNLNKVSEKLSIPGVTPAAVKPRTKPWLIASAVTVGIAAIALAGYLLQPAAVLVEAPQIDSIAIPPFVNVTGGEDGASLCIGIPQSISNSLARLGQLRIKPTTVLLRYEGMNFDPQQVSEEQGVKAVLIGRVEHRGKTLVVSVELIDGRDSTLILGKTYGKEFGDSLALQEEIAQEVARELLPELTPEESESLAQIGTENPEAHDDFIMAQYHLGRFSPESVVISYLESAISKDPNYQQAYESLANVRFHSTRSGTPSLEGYARAREVAERGIAVDESTALAHTMKARILWHWERKWREAEQEYVRAIELDPAFGEDIGFLDWMGRREEALEQIQKGVEQSDPLNPLHQLWWGIEFLMHREFDRAIEQAKKVMALNPEDTPHWILQMSYKQKGMENEAFEEMLQRRRLEQGVGEEQIAELRKAFEDSGLDGVSRLQPHPEPPVKISSTRPEAWAAHYARLGDYNKAFEWLEKAWCSDLPLWGFENAPSCWRWDSLRDDPRFEKLLRRVNLPEEAIQRHLAPR